MSTQLAELERSADDVKVAGVCAALARSYDVDPTLVRVAMLMLALCSGIGLVLYGVAWALLPRAGEGLSPLRRTLPSFPRLPRGAWIAAIVVASLAVASVGEMILPFGMVTGAMLLWLARWWARRVDASSVAEQHRPPVVPSSATWPLLPELAESALAAPAVVAPVSPRRGRRTLWTSLATIAIALVAMCVATPIISRHLPPTNAGVAALAVLTIVLGAGLIAGSFTGRPWGLAVVTAVMTLSLGITNAAASVDASPHGLGDVDARPTTVTDVTNERTSMGNIDATYADLSVTRNTSASLSTNMGNVTVILPREGNVVVNWSTNFGSYSGPDRHVNGPTGRGQFTRITDPAAPTLTITMISKMGDLTVMQP